MRPLRAWFWRMGGLFNKDAKDRELAAEIESHLQMQMDDNLRSGMAMGEARRLARVKFGGVETMKENYRERRGLPGLETLLQDLKFGARMLGRNPGFTFVAVLTLGLGIGANTAIFSVVNAVLLRALPYENGDRLVRVEQEAPRAGFLDQPFSVAELTDYRTQNHTLDALVEYHNMAFILLGRAEPERVRTGVVSWNYFDVFGVRPLLGRGFRSDDEKPGAPAVLMLSYDYWIRSFGGDPTVVNKTFTMNDKLHTVIGVLPPLPSYPNANDVYMPSTACPFRSAPAFVADRKSRMMTAFGLRKPRVSVAQAQADLMGVAHNLQREYADAYPPNVDYGTRIVELRDEMTHQARPTMLMLLGAAGFVLLIACANVANLNLARMVRRERELAVRVALGAGRMRLFRQLFTESLLLALLGGGVGLLLAHNGMALLVKFVALFTPRAGEIHIDRTVLLFTLSLAVVTSLISGSIAAFDARVGGAGNLKEGSAQSTIGVGRRRLRNVLIVAQVAVSLLLLVGAGLMLRSFINLQHVDPGFQPENVLTMQLNLNFSKYNTNDKQRAFFEALLDKLQTQPGVRSAAAGMTFPLEGMGPMLNDFRLEGDLQGHSMPVGDFRVVSPGYFETLKIPILEGRDFTRLDRPGAPDVAIVNRTAARHFWGSQDPVGKRISTDGGKTWGQIIGVVGDVKQYGLDQGAADEIYVPLANAPLLNANLVIKTAVEPLRIARKVIEQIYEIDRNQPAARVRSLEQVRDDSIAAPRLSTDLLGLFALLALVIAAAGIGGVMALAVSQRTHELGVRMAIGALPHDILRMVLRQGLAITAIGVALGLAGALALTRILHGLLFEVTPSDPLTFAGVALVLALVAAVACYIPARRASRVDPMVALRCE